MKRYACGIWAVVALAMLIGIGPAQGAIMPDGTEGTDANSEFLFGDSASSPSNELVLTFDVGGPLIISAGSNQGWWSDTHSNTATNANYFVGDLSNDLTSLHNNFFSFDVSSVGAATVTAAELRLQKFWAYSSTGNTEHTYSLYDVHTDSVTLNNNVGTSAAIFTDLGSGAIYGHYGVTVGGDETVILSFELNEGALMHINSTSGVFSIGGALFPTGDSWIIPEPTTFIVWSVLAALGIATGWWRKRKRNV